jgi:hypothetical protein
MDGTDQIASTGLLQGTVNWPGLYNRIKNAYINLIKNVVIIPPIREKTEETTEKCRIII